MSIAIALAENKITAIQAYQQAIELAIKEVIDKENLDTEIEQQKQWLLDHAQDKHCPTCEKFISCPLTELIEFDDDELLSNDTLDTLDL